jgi:hypothetical protein
MGHDDVVVAADAVDSMISGLEENGKNCNPECKLPKYSLQRLYCATAWHNTEAGTKSSIRFSRAAGVLEPLTPWQNGIATR